MGFVTLVYGGVCYALFFAAFLYLIPFIGGEMVAFAQAPKTLDWGLSPVPDAYAAIVNIGLLLAFGLQHTIMARQGFKALWTKFVAPPIERSTYVLATTALLVLLYVYWTPIPALVWEVRDPAWYALITAAFYVGFGLVLLSTFLIDHFELFGLAQVWRRYKGQEQAAPSFKTPSFYKNVRHPLYLGWVISFWATPAMSAGHLLFAALWTIYIFVALGYEERDLVRHFGDQYRDYMARVPMILPWGRKKD
jgi:protein-S-isoprenylcysteine O-methyltransferase Ste14